ncbi:serine/threonine-protein kinase [Dokdonella fugitiva]|jgi:non-specific serine/threonine protein kinase/serine/threonine-protein kinase|uniref:Non-specific serine/threonine protein kinase/serine/threonine-protein kinase n=1 Tax=Dokdonella fugitiva TaxID=328517 RepID=A0A4R2IB64_9GAMM|nr:serine/threonine-protein kinase [Dokdonella fugitiva]TCO41346.1 non-specific serine/threonine protein kinase/serine/threonine-protein kinase [Dokdonella fugitiva]
MHGDETSADDATEFIGRTAATGSAEALEPGMQLGPYLIRSVLGEGGMGRVYLAEQLRPVHRDVALKLIREQVASPLARAYFDVERQALAQMQHPAIAQVFDAGTTEQGYPYLAMEVVEGVPITRFCREQQLGRDARLALFARVCHGVQHAHQKGIIHRDLKPANVLVRRVDGTPMPKIIDFGIAIGGIADAGSGVAASATVAERAGTSLYMSPEQAQPHGIDTRSDVYSLGVMLYEVLTDADAAAVTPIAHHSTRRLHETLLAAIDSDTAVADAANASGALLASARHLPGGLRAILRKALATDRADRYDSAAALADDLERYRERRPLKAVEPTRWYLARTFVARHRLGLAVSALIALSLVAGIALALDGLARARRSAAIAEIEAAKADRVAAFTRGMLAGIDPNRAKGMDRSLMHLVLDSAAERAGRELADQPAVRASIERTIADSYSSLGDYAVAQRHYDAALAAGKQAGLPAAAQARTRARAATNLFNHAPAANALALARQAFAEVADLPADDRDRLAIESSLGAIEGMAGRPEEARARLQRVLAAQRRLFGDEDEDVLVTSDDLASIDIDTAHLDEARPLLEGLLERRMKQYGAENSKTVDAVNGLAIIALEQKRYADAEGLLAPQLPTVERVFGKDHPLTMRLISNLGGAIRQQGRNEDARPYYERTAALAARLYGPTNPATVIAESNLSLLLRDAGDLAAAEAHGRTAVGNASAAFGDNAIRGIIHREFATVLVRERKFEEAEKELLLAWDVFFNAEGYGPRHPRSQDVVDTCIELYGAWRKPDKEALWRGRKASADATAAAASP